jgi:small-conductance mechanosensitive channel
MDYARLQQAVRDSLHTLAENASAYVPNLIGALFLLAAGWLLARVLRASVRRIAGSVVVHVGRISGTADLQRPGTHTAVVEALASGVYWLVLLVFFLAAVHLLELPFLRSIAAATGAYLPHVIAAAFVVLVGYVAGGLARGAIARSSRASGVAYGELLGRIVQTAVVIVALIVAVDELGIDNTFLVVSSAIVLAATLGGAAVAFGLGARTSVHNLLASHYVQRNFRPGHVVRINGIEGRILEIGETSVVIETVEGRVHIPARLFSEEVSTLLTEAP